MAVYRHVHVNYWQDGFVLDLTPEEKYFYIYLMTNSKTSQCGIYELPKRIIETETGYNRESVEKLIKRFVEYEKIAYCEETKEIFIKNWVRHNKLNSPMVKKCVEKELLQVKHTDFIKMFLKECERCGYTVDTKGIPDIGDEENINIQEENNNSISKFKILYEQNVGLINAIVGEWLIEISEVIDYELFKRAVEIATDKGKPNKGYINGILKQWRDNNIKSLRDLKAYEQSIKNRGEYNEGSKCKHTKPKHARASEKEDDDIYRKPTEEELREFEREITR